ncbi:GNAT family N-acetyltransferase [Aureliella helgolandensis]|uniref:BioF2-like acetyltransferase domain-containing protein n=1 Tax=Aureliella helgolandensis TaxID=2527968 RepID=A0A518GAL0_9BACT|nr:GNAT family N-acetyltransferase [Aureliella helgolandensis]QDV25636.1 hypothetical protein Q31a_39620 [Aureliella helgolandensis]
MKILLIDSLDEWELWRRDWQSLTEHNVMLSYEWLRAWWAHFGVGHGLHILAVIDEDRLVGFAPWYQHATPLGNQLRYLGSGRVCSDYVTAVATPHLQAEVFVALLAATREAIEQGQFGKEHMGFQLEGAAADDEWLQQLTLATERQRYSQQTQELESSWRIELPECWEAFCKQNLAKSTLRKAKKAKARIASGELCFRQLNRVGDLQEGLDALIRLHQARRSSLGDEGCFADPRFEPFLKQAVEGLLSQQAARFVVCEVEDQIIGVQLQFVSGSSIQMYQSGVDPAFMRLEPGHALVYYSVENAIEEGRSYYDFLRGDEPYKAHWGAQPISLVRRKLIAPNWRAQTVALVERKLHWLKDHSKKLFQPASSNAE